MTLLTVFIRIALGSLFVYAGTSKLLAPDDFGATIIDLLPVGRSEGKFLGQLVAAGECLAGVMLVIGWHTRVAGGTIAVMIAGFLLMYIPAMTDPASDVTCGCFGERSRVDWTFFLRNILLLSAALFVRRSKRHRWSVDELLRKR